MEIFSACLVAIPFQEPLFSLAYHFPVTVLMNARNSFYDVARYSIALPSFMQR